MIIYMVKMNRILLLETAEKTIFVDMKEIIIFREEQPVIIYMQAPAMTILLEVRKEPIISVALMAMIP